MTPDDPALAFDETQAMSDEEILSILQSIPFPADIIRDMRRIATALSLRVQAAQALDMLQRQTGARQVLVRYYAGKQTVQWYHILHEDEETPYVVLRDQNTVTIGGIAYSLVLLPVDKGLRAAEPQRQERQIEDPYEKANARTINLSRMLKPYDR